MQLNHSQGLKVALEVITDQLGGQSMDEIDAVGHEHMEEKKL